MKVVQFYRGEPNTTGDTLEQIMQYSLYTMEIDHDYIQWLLPSNETSAVNEYAPTLTKEEAEILAQDPVLRQKVKASFLKFINFLGLQLIEQPIEYQIVSLAPTQERPAPLWWMGYFNHNMLRITRCLKCMRLTGHEKYALALFEFLNRNKLSFDTNTFNYWNKAIYDDLW